MNRNKSVPNRLVFLLAISLLLSSCNMPAPATSPAELPPSSIEPLELATPTALPAEASETPPAAGSAATESPTTESPAVSAPTLTPSADCARAEFVADVTYPDNVSVKANEAMTKTWRVKNTGSCAWDSAYRLVFIRGEQMGGPSPAEIITDPVNPGSEANLSIQLTAPDINGLHWGVWQIYDGSGKPVLKANGKPQELSILVNVTNGRGGRVVSVRTWSYTFEGAKCTNNVRYEVAAHIYVDGAVSVSYTWGATNGVLTVVSQTYLFENAGSLKVVTQINPPFANPNDVRVTLTANGVSSSFTICP